MLDTAPVTPVGTPRTLKSTLPEKPPDRVTVADTWMLSPCATDPLVGVIEMEMTGVGPVPPLPEPELHPTAKVTGSSQTNTRRKPTPGTGHGIQPPKNDGDPKTGRAGIPINT